jgi:hypothetical protein
MITMRKLAPLFLAAAAFAAPAFAQDAAVTLRVDAGTAMASTGGEYASASTGTALSTGQSIMVGENSAVTLVYDGGCTIKINTPGTYNVPDTCTRAGWVNSGNDMAAAGIIIGTAVLVGVAIDQMGDEPVGPLSDAVRHF